jgi:pSer/pThr/pTyr-binding forkhead associated (FHA) protein
MALLERQGPAGHDLVVLDGRGTISIGKSADTDLVIDGDPAVSRLHAKLEPVGPGWCISDLGSTNGTTVNGHRLYAPRTLHDGDEIVLGRTRLMFRDLEGRKEATTDRLARPPRLTSGEQRVLVELCRPVLSGRAFTPPSSVRAIAEALYVTESAVKQHLDRLCDKFGIFREGSESRRVRLANEALQRGAVSLADLKEDGSPREVNTTQP